MRKFLLWLGTMWVGMMTLALVLTVLTGAAAHNAGAFLGFVVLWLVALAGGVLLSAPAFLNSPEDNGGIWSFWLPLPVWLFVIMLKVVSWAGFYILLGTWMLIFKVWTTHQSNRMPSFSNAPQQQQFQSQQPFAGQPYPGQQSSGQPYPGQSYPGGQPFVPRQPGASWQTDPTGRHQQRWWDATNWTDRVLNGGVQAVDPLTTAR